MTLVFEVAGSPQQRRALALRSSRLLRRGAAAAAVPSYGRATSEVVPLADGGAGGDCGSVGRRSESGPGSLPAASVRPLPQPAGPPP